MPASPSRSTRASIPHRIPARYPWDVTTPTGSHAPSSSSRAGDGAPSPCGNNDPSPGKEYGALELLPGEFTGAVQQTTVGIVDDPGFIPPLRVDRTPITYDLLAYFVHALAGAPLATDATLAAAFGLRAEDVSRARSAWANHVERVGSPCPVCGKAIDPAFSAQCWPLCKTPVKGSRRRRRAARAPGPTPG